jgi:hypothetical protein
MRRLLVILSVVAVAAAFASAAGAATFDVNVCASDPGLSSLAVAAANSQPGTLTTAANCRRDPVDQLDGLGAFDQAGAPNTPAGGSASWTLAAAPGTRIASVRLRRSLGKRDNTWDVWTRTAEGATIETCEIVSSISCTVGAMPTNPQSSTTYTGLNTESLSWGVSCGATIGTCPNGLSLHYAWAVVYGLTATVDDPAPPQLQPLVGSLVGPARWHAGTEQATVPASDASGARRLELLVDGTVVAASDQTCDYTRMRPCPAAAQFTGSVDLAALPDGVHEVAGRAVDAGGQPASTASTAITVDTRAPAAPLAMGAAANDDGSITARWANPDQRGGAPIAAAHYQFCPIGSDTGCAGGGIASGDGINTLERIRPPAGGAPWDLVIWLQDAAGHADRGSAARQTVIVRPPDSGTGTRGPTPGASKRKTTRLRIADAALRNGRLHVRGVAVRSLRGRVTVALRKTRYGRPAGRKATVVRGGRFVAVLDVRGRGVPWRGYLTAHFSGSKEYRAATVVRRPVKDRRAASRLPGTLFVKQGTP